MAQSKPGFQLQWTGGFVTADGAIAQSPSLSAIGNDGLGLTKGHVWATMGNMSAVVKSRIDAKLKRQAEGILEEIGLKPRAALELFYKQIIKRRAIPFPVQADSPEDEVLSPARRRNALADEF